MALQEELVASQAERLKMEEDYTQKLEKAQAFYENELQALRQNQSSSYEAELSRLREQQERLKQDFSAQEGELRKQIDSLVRQLAETEDVAEAQKLELENLRRELGNKDSSAESIAQMVRRAQFSIMVVSVQSPSLKFPLSYQHRVHRSNFGYRISTESVAQISISISVQNASFKW